MQLKKTQTTSGGEIISSVYGTDWPVRLGRQDSSEPAPAGRIPADDAPVSEIVAFMKTLGVKDGKLLCYFDNKWYMVGFLVVTC